MANTDFHPTWHGRRGGPRALRLALPLAAIGAARLARRGGAQRVPLPLPFMLPLALFGASRLAMMGHGGRRGPGPFGGRPPFDPDGSPPFRPAGPGLRPG